jgi:DNA/RNA endonuclease G (NUC1)
VIFQDRDQLRALAFQYKNQDETFDIPAHEVTVKEVEQETGLDFLSALPDNEKKGIETYKATEQEIETIFELKGV